MPRKSAGKVAVFTGGLTGMGLAPSSASFEGECMAQI
jgi:hypothetical protein